MNLTLLAIGWLLLAAGDIAPKFIKDEDQASWLSFWLASIAFVIFASGLIASFNQ